jgi:release factor H-coupled RctB family protein
MTLRNQPLPAHAALISAPDVWMESDALAQLADVAALPGCVRAAGMPDLHPGRGFPVGAVVATRDVVYPQLVGGDAGCGARILFTRVHRASADRLERRARDAWSGEAAHEVDAEVLFRAAWAHGARGLADIEGLPGSLRALCAREPIAAELPESGDPERLLGAAGAARAFGGALGSIGGGNHFAEIARVTRVWDHGRASALGCERGSFAVLVHSGSRGLGAALEAAFRGGALVDGKAAEYLALLAGACRFAQANRILLAYRLACVLGAARESALGGGFDVTHNDVRIADVVGQRAFLHRKGAAPARDDEPTLVLGSRGTPSLVMSGTGSETALFSVAHGAGRRMRRGEAREKLRARYLRKQLARSGGGRVVCDDGDVLYEEHPDAYKDIAPIIDALVAHATARRVAELTPVLTVKL